MGKSRSHKAITMKPKKKIRQGISDIFNPVSKKKRLLGKKSSDDISFSRPGSFSRPEEKTTRSLAKKFANKLFDSTPFHSPIGLSSALRNKKRSDRSSSKSVGSSPLRKKRTLGKRFAENPFDFTILKATKKRKSEKGHEEVVPSRETQNSIIQSKAPRRQNLKPVVKTFNRNRSKWSSSSSKAASSVLALPKEISTKGNRDPLKDLEVEWVAKTITSYRHTEYHYGCSIIAKANKQWLGGTSFRRYSNSCWELELTTKKEALEVRFGDDFMVIRVDVKSPQKKTFEIGFMHWSQKLRITMNTGREDFDDYFPIDLKTSRFEQKKPNVSTLKLISKFNEAFISEALRRLTPMQFAVHQAVIDEYKKFAKSMKPFITIVALVRTIWCYAATPAVLGTRAMCELRERLIGAFRPNGFEVVTLAPTLGKFCKRALDDLVQGDEACSWVAKACQRVGDFQKVLANEAGLAK